MPTLFVILPTLAGFVACFAVSNLLSWRDAERDRSAGYFGLVCLAFAAYSLLQLWILSSNSPTSVAVLLRWQGAALAVTFGSVVFFGAAFTHRRLDWFDGVVVATYVGLGLWSLMSPAGYWFSSVTAMEGVTVPGGTLYHPRGTIAWTYYVSIVIQYPLFLRQIWDGWRIVRRGSVIDGSLWMIGVSAIVIGSVHDHLVDFGALAPPYLGEYPFPLLMLAMGSRYAVRRSREFAKLRELQASLASSEAKLRDLFESSADAIFIHDSTTHEILDVNRTMTEMFGYSREECLSLTVGKLSGASPEVAQQRSDERLAEAFEQGMTTFEWQARRNDGSVFPVEVTLKRSEIAHRTCVVANVRDVSRRRELEDRLRQAQRLEAIGHLAGGVAHDFNNLLTPIMGHVELVMEGLPDSDPSRSDLQHVLAAAERAKRLTRQLLTFGRKAVLEIQPVDLGNLLRGMVPLLRGLVREDIDLRVHKEAEGLIVTADASQLEQVVMNLVVNARDAMPDGGLVSVSIARQEVDTDFGPSAKSIAPGEYAVLTVSDTGRGMTPEVKSRIFEPFFTTKSVGRGTGLGLATVLGVVQQHQGTVVVYSEPDKGTTFRVYLPLGIVTPVATFSEPEPRSLCGGTEVVLVVEDDDAVRALTCLSLERYGYRTYCAASPDLAIGMFAQLPTLPTLLVADVIMPKKSGRELFENLRRTSPTLRVLYMSGYSGDVIWHHGVLESEIVLLQKPFSVRALLAKVRLVLDA